MGRSTSHGRRGGVPLVTHRTASGRPVCAARPMRLRAPIREVLVADESVSALDAGGG
ncbi:hypothetical protein [Modestobacter sp. I12A-02662]|uniref:hypothetical protein n=1 Tax=Modestobacter sp. I12A-02662 TaxID=1730496 RepID=UPI0034DFF6C0